MTVEIQLGPRSYSITIARGAVREAAAAVQQQGPGRLILLTDENVARHHLATVRALLPIEPIVAIIAPGDASKSLREAERIFELLANQGVGRDALLLALGGGVVGDLGGFVAATWHRGIAYIQIPTSLEAAIDASVGGKTAVNLRQGKNLVGAFYQPRAVLIDLDFLPTLPDREWTAALAESVKHAAITSDDFFSWHEQHADAVASRDPLIASELIRRNCATKAAIVAADERETRGRREFLNYGHTIGHAIETACDYELRHGECVALGIQAENSLATGRGLLPVATAARVTALLGKLGLPAECPAPLDVDRVLDACGRDKKNRGGRVAFALIRGIGSPERFDDFSQDEIRAAVESVVP